MTSPSTAVNTVADIMDGLYPSPRLLMGSGPVNGAAVDAAMHIYCDAGM